MVNIFKFKCAHTCSQHIVCECVFESDAKSCENCVTLIIFLSSSASASKMNKRESGDERWDDDDRKEMEKNMCEQNEEGKKVMALVDVWVIAMLCQPALSHICTVHFGRVQLSLVWFGLVLLCYVLFLFVCVFCLLSRMANGSIEQSLRSNVCGSKNLLSTLSHTHRIQMRNENLMILFALLFASFRNLFILHSFVHSVVHFFVFRFPPSGSSVLFFVFSLFNEHKTNDHYY